jgi:dTDP-4-amino-4,6-dideoxygalactose transaminase
MIPLFKVFMPLSVKAPLLETLFSGYIGQGEQVEKFEACLSEYIDNPYALTVNSGTSGLQLALRLANVGSGDEVISTPMTCTATNMAIMACGARIVWADIDPVSGNIDPEDVQKKITPKTKAVMMVHWGGTPCEIDAVQAVAADHGIRVIEDAAHSMGAEYNGKKIGNHSDFVVFSFQAVKQMTTIDGGVLFCRRKADYERGKRLRWFGIDRKLKGAEVRHECEQNIPEWGYKFHMNDVCAVIGIEQLKYLDANLQKSRDTAQFYAQELEGIEGVTTVPVAADIKGSFLFYTLHIHKEHAQFSDYMYKKRIMVSQVHARNDKNHCFKPFSKGQLLGVDAFVRTMMCIPSGWWVDDSAKEKIVFAIRSYFDRL